MPDADARREVDATLHGIARSIVMSALVDDQRILDAFAELDAGEPPDVVERRILATLEELDLAWPWLRTEIRLAYDARRRNRGRADWYLGRARGIVAESAEPATLTAVPSIPALPSIGPGMTEPEAVIELDAWYRRARRAIEAVAERRHPGRRPAPASLEAIRGYAGWLVRRRLNGETIRSIAMAGLDDSSSATPADRGTWIRDGIRRADELLATEPAGTLLARGESKDAGIDALALPLPDDVAGDRMAP